MRDFFDDLVSMVEAFRIADAVVSGDVVWVNAADNERLYSWLGPFNDPDVNGHHNRLGDDEFNGINVQIGDLGGSPAFVGKMTGLVRSAP